MKYNIDDRKSATRELQRLLLEISYSTDIPHVAIDGIYGRRTREAVRRFQCRCGLPQTGETDYDTWCALLKEYRTACHMQSRAHFNSAKK